MFANPTPALLFAAPNPTPSSVTVTTIDWPSRRAAISTLPHLSASPCSIAFSPSVTSTMGGNALSLQFRCDVEREMKPSAHPNLEQLQIRLHEFELVAQGRFGSSDLWECGTRVSHQVIDRLGAGPRVLATQSAYVGKRVEQKIRLDLGLRQLLLRLFRLAFELLPRRLKLPRRVVCTSSMTTQGSHPENERSERRKAD